MMIIRNCKFTPELLAGLQRFAGEQSVKTGKFVSFGSVVREACRRYLVLRKQKTPVEALDKGEK